MLSYSFSSVLMAVLTSDLIIVLIAFCFRHNNVLLTVGYRVLLAFLFLALMRLAFPFELPVARMIYFPEFLSVPFSYFQYSSVYLSGLPISLWTVFECIWLGGIIYRLYGYVRKHMTLLRQLDRYSTDITKQEPYRTLLAQICGRKRNPFRVLKVCGISTPSIFGVIKPRILIPSEMCLTDTDLYYSLCHETSHYFHRDLWIHFIVSVLTIVYWWNPACQLLRKQVDMLLEMRVDGALVKKDSVTARTYLATLVHIAEESVRLRTTTSSALPENLLLSFAKESEGPLIQRYKMMFNTGNRRAHIPVAVILSILVFSLYLGSYLITFENTHTTEHQAESLSSPITCSISLS